jgi:hypothetical protein
MKKRPTLVICTSGLWIIDYLCPKNRLPWEITKIAVGLIKGEGGCLVSLVHISDGAEFVTFDCIYSGLLGQMFIPLKLSPGDQLRFTVTDLDGNQITGNRVRIQMWGQE